MSRRHAAKASARCGAAAATTTAMSPTFSSPTMHGSQSVYRGRRRDLVGHVTEDVETDGCALYSSFVTLLPRSTSRTVPTNSRCRRLMGR